MGKAGKPKRKTARAGQYGEQGGHAVQDSAAIAAMNERAKETPGVLKQLESPDASEREHGCETLAHLAEHAPRALHGFIEQGTHNLVTLLSDPITAVRVAAAGALRNLTFAGSNACDIMVKNDLLTPVLSTIERVSPAIVQWAQGVVGSGTGAISSEVHQHVQLLLNVLSALWNICEQSPEGCDIFSSSPALSALLPVVETLPQTLTSSITPPEGLEQELVQNTLLELCTTVLHVLFVVVDDSPRASQQIRAAGNSVKTLMQLAEAPISPLLSALSLGILWDSHTVPDELPALASVITPVLTSLTQLLGRTDGSLAHLASLEPRMRQCLQQGQQAGQAETLVSNAPFFQEWRRAVSSRRVALETLAHIALSVADDDDNNDSHGGAGRKGASKSSKAIPTARRAILTALEQHSILSGMLALSAGGDEKAAIATLSSDFPDVTPHVKQLETIRVVANGVIANLLSVNAVSKVEETAAIWENACTSAYQGHHEKREDILSSALRTMAILLRQYGPHSPQGGTTTRVLIRDTGTVSKICEYTLAVARASGHGEETQCHAIEILNGLAPLVQDKSFFTAFALLLVTSALGKSPSVVNAALNAIFDTFSEKDHDDILAKLKVLSHLEKAQDTVPPLIRQCQQEGEDLHAAELMNCLENLEAWFDYKHSNQ